MGNKDHSASGQVTPAPEVLTKAVVRVATRLGLSRVLLAKILGISRTVVTRLLAGDYLLDRGRKEWDAAVLLVRVYRSLDSIVGTETTAQQWINSENRGLNGRPIDLMATGEGLERVEKYLDASLSIEGGACT